MEDNLRSRTTMLSAEVVGHNQDLLAEILLRVPAKPLLKFKCVSKQWLSLISDPKFCLSHTRHFFNHKPTPSALFLKKRKFRTGEFPIIPLKDDPKIPYLDYLNVPLIIVLQSCNGLLLCSYAYLGNPSEQSWENKMPVKLMEDRMGVNYFIFNPTTKQFKIISHGLKLQFRAPSIFLAFDPLKSPHYKVLLFHQVDIYKYDIDIYFSETDSWSFKRHSFQAPFRLNIYRFVFSNGAIHWLNETNLYQEKQLEGGYSLYFKVDSESMKTFPMPPMDVNCVVNYFGESRGHLHMGMTTKPPALEFDVWELELDYSGWFVKYHVNLQSVKMEFPALDWDHEPYMSPFKILSLIRAEKEEESTLVLFVDHKAISYSLFFGTSSELCGLQLITRHPNPFFPGRLDYQRIDTHEYIETLIHV